MTLERASAERQGRGNSPGATAQTAGYPSPVTTALGRPTPLPNGSVLLHVGPHKTGTTALQAALWAARDELQRQGVRLAGRSRNPAGAVRAVTGQASPYADDGRTPPMWRWGRLAGEVKAAREPRVVVSSEFFAWANPTAIRRIVDDLGPERVHVAVTLRPLSRIVPSMWQQNVQAGTVSTIDAWLRDVLAKTDGEKRHPFWTLQRHDELIDRWAAVLGIERVSAVVVDDRDHDVLLHAFEDLLGLSGGTLVGQSDWLNRSLTLPEAEAVRAFNLAARERHLSRGRHARLMRFGAAQVMKQRVPSAAEERVRQPDWAGAAIEAIQRDIVAAIRSSAVRVIGDLDRLLATPSAHTARPDSAAVAANEPPPADVQVPADAAAAMAMGILLAAGEGRPGPSRLEIAEPVQVLDVPTYQLAAVIALRAWRWAFGLADRVVGRFRRPSVDTPPLVEP
jgi:hypothetical protein